MNHEAANITIYPINCLEEETKNITLCAQNWCTGNRGCTVDSNDFKWDGCSYSQIKLTYGCQIRIGKYQIVYKLQKLKLFKRNFCGM